LIADALIARLRAARRVVVFTGAGVSEESGIATFRDRQTGLWEHFDAAALATPQAFEDDPALVWGWYEWRRAAVLRAQPNRGHQAIARMHPLVPELTLITQNVDDLHERAGSPAVLHLHGRITQARCEACAAPHALEACAPAGEERRMEPPRCPVCGARIRPGVVWFGEALPQAEWRAAAEAAGRAEVFLCVGTSSVVQPAASLTDIAARAGAVTVQVNPNATAIDDEVTFSYRARAGSILPDLVKEAWPDA
jgi:NAD-dependent deacetylase